MFKMVAGLTAVAVLACSAGSAAAEADRRPLLGMTLSQVQAAFPSALPSARQDGSVVMGLTNVTFASTHWDRVVMRFGVTGRLETVRFEERGATYDDVRSRVYEQMNQNTATKVETGLDLEPDAAQYRLCESADGLIALTLERPSLQI